VFDTLGTGAALIDASGRVAGLAGRIETRPHRSDRPTRRITIVGGGSTLVHPTFAGLDHDARFTGGAHGSSSTDCRFMKATIAAVRHRQEEVTFPPALRRRARVGTATCDDAGGGFPLPSRADTYEM
jgi:hypothetical protein